MGMKQRLIVVMVLGMLGAAAAAARADEGDPEMQGPPTKPALRSGWTAGIAVGPGELHVIPDDSDKEPADEGPAFSVRLGVAVSQSFLVMGLTEFVEGSGGSNALYGGAIQFYLSERIFVRAGGGLTRYTRGGSSSDPEVPASSKSYLGVGAMGGVGSEWLQLQDLGLTVEMMFMANRPDLPEGAKGTIVNGSIMLGIQWF